MEENGVRLADAQVTTATKLQEEAKTVVYFSNAKNVLAVIAIADKIKATSKVAIEACIKGIDVYMLQAIMNKRLKRGQSNRLTHYKADMLPSGKAIS